MKQQEVKFMSESETVYVFTIHELEVLSDLVNMVRSALRTPDLEFKDELIALNKLWYLLEHESGEI